MPRGSDSSKIFVNSKVISRLDKIEADLISQSKEASKTLSVVKESVVALASHKSMIDEQNEAYQKLCATFADSTAKISVNISDLLNSQTASYELLKTSVKELITDSETSFKETQIELCAKINTLFKSFFDRIESIESKHNQLCAEVTSLKDLMCAPKVEEESQTVSVSSTSESEVSSSQTDIPDKGVLQSKFSQEENSNGPNKANGTKFRPKFFWTSPRY